jgi:hypothetical protein
MTINMKEEEEKVPKNFQDNFIHPDRAAILNDIKEDPEEYQDFDRSSSLNSNTLKKFLSNDDFKFSSESPSPKYSNYGESGILSVPEYVNSYLVKTSKVAKKGMIFYNERILTLTTSSRLSYESHGYEKVIDLNPTTTIRQITNTKFEITNYYPTTKYLFRTNSELE